MPLVQVSKSGGTAIPQVIGPFYKISCNFLHHGFFSNNWTERLDLIHIVLIRHEAFLPHTAVLAPHQSWALKSVVIAFSPIDRAGLICHFGLMHELIGWDGVTPVTAEVVHGTREDLLIWDVNVWPLGFSRNLYSVREGGSCSGGPTWTTVLGNILILHMSKVISPVDIIPKIAGQADH